MSAVTLELIVELSVFLTYIVFIAGKVTGVLAAWSWWWMLFPFVPTMARGLGWG